MADDENDVPTNMFFAVCDSEDDSVLFDAEGRALIFSTRDQAWEAVLEEKPEAECRIDEVQVTAYEK